jgi:phosphoglycolate phosphatase
MIRNVIFDWSGTLVNDLPAVWEATNFVFRQAGWPLLTLDQFRAEFRLPFTEFYARFKPPVPQNRLEAWFHSHFRKVQDSVVELPHAREFLEFCRARSLRTFVLSTVHEDHFLTQARRLGFLEYLDRPYLGVWDKRVKILELLAENEMRPTETLFVGDMEHDIETARHGGTFSCAVLTGYNHLDQLRRSGPDLIVEHLGELQRILVARDLEVRPSNGKASALEPAEGPVATVGAVIYDRQDRMLLVRTHKWSNRWGIPGGKIKRGEKAEAALIRELKEETGLEVTDVQFVLVQDCIHSREFYRDAHFVLLNYTCRSRTDQTVRLNEEAREFRWLTLAEAWQYDLNQPTRTLLEAIRKLSSIPRSGQ